MSDFLKVEGTLVMKSKVQTISTKKGEMKKQSFVIETGTEERSNPVQFNTMKEAIIEKLSTLKKGSKLEVLFNVNGREWETPDGEVKYFVDLSAWGLNTK